MSLAPVGRLGSSLDPMICPACSANPLRLLRLSGRQRRAEEQEGEEDDDADGAAPHADVLLSNWYTWINLEMDRFLSDA
jgi:hypothetical protein